eukprot:TRINITY_DN2043_c0_g1_i1.p1 TRINITY_DN2043_c0_g1~~TRINITY_DN2043_c0_g1_i1.p1  ORF type:complete len:110 (+),score=13.44 TRINITY_DN2043_c0_g1_i1:623-952(+)
MALKAEVHLQCCNSPIVVQSFEDSFSVEQIFPDASSTEEVRRLWLELNESSPIKFDTDGHQIWPKMASWTHELVTESLRSQIQAWYAVCKPRKLQAESILSNLQERGPS